MKSTTTILALLFILLGDSISSAQDLLDALKQTAEMHNEANAEEQGNNAEGTETTGDGQNEWEEAWENEMEENTEVLEALDTKYLKCVALMVFYVHTYLQLVNEHKLGDITMSACDAHGMQALAMASSTTVMYCPEEMAQLSDEELKSIGDDFWAAIDQFTVDRGPWQDPEYHPILSKLQYIIANFFRGVQDQDAGDMSVFNGSPDTPVHVIKYMIEFFRPRYIIPQALKIAQEMEAMGCSG
jgi:hypothetical protein